MTTLGPPGCQSVADHTRPDTPSGPSLPQLCAEVSADRTKEPGTGLIQVAYREEEKPSKKDEDRKDQQPGEKDGKGKGGKGTDRDAALELPSPVVPPPIKVVPINLETALDLAGADNPTIALALEAIQASLAEQLRARALLLPNLNAGLDFNLHTGNLQSGRGIIRDVQRQSLYLGAGAAAVGAGTVTIPGVRLFGHLADAWFEPKAAGWRVAGTQFESLAVRNAILLNVTTQYFDLIGTEERSRAVGESEADFREVARLTADHARAGQGREADAERARAETLLLHTEAERLEERAAVAAAELARLLHMDPAVRLRGAGEPLPLINLVDLGVGLEKLIQIALDNRPELGARDAAIAETRTHLHQEKARPFLPLLSVGFSAGDFGGGGSQATTHFAHFNGRTDFDAYAVWSLENFGLGNIANQNVWQARVHQALAARIQMVDQIRTEVSEAYTVSADSQRRLEVARRELKTAREAYRLDLERSKQLEGKPIEVLNSATLLAAARQDYIRALVAYDQAQFQLFVALGQPPALPAVVSKVAP